MSKPLLILNFHDKKINYSLVKFILKNRKVE